MKFESINKVYTSRVTEWIEKGYWINAGTMGGSQGELAHVDLTNGTELIRVFMEEACGYGKPDSVVVIVGRCTDKRVVIGAADRLGNTVWNNDLEIITEDRFYRIGKKWGSQWFGTMEEVMAARSKAAERRKARNDSELKPRVFNGAEKLMLGYVKRNVKGCKTARLADITCVEKSYDIDFNGTLRGASYYVIVKGIRVKLA